VPGLLVSVYALFVVSRQIMKPIDRQVAWAVAIFVAAIALMALFTRPGSIANDDNDWRDGYTRYR
jgi:cation transport ATPase